MSSLDCPHGSDLATCRVCNPPAPVHVVGRPFIAQYEGICDDCQVRIQVGERIARLSDDRYVHDDCVRKSWRKKP